MVGVGGEKLIGKRGGNTDRETRNLRVEAEAQASGSKQGKANIGCLACFSCVCRDQCQSLSTLRCRVY